MRTSTLKNIGYAVLIILFLIGLQISYKIDSVYMKIILFIIFVGIFLLFRYWISKKVELSGGNKNSTKERMQIISSEFSTSLVFTGYIAGIGVILFGIYIFIAFPQETQAPWAMVGLGIIGLIITFLINKYGHKKANNINP